MPKSNLNFLRVGLPFFAIVFGSAFGLHYFQQVRFDYSKVKKERDTVSNIHDSLEKAGVKVRKNLTVEDIYQEVAETDTENWENIRGPREFEDNQQYEAAKKRQKRRRSTFTTTSSTKTMMVSNSRDPNFIPNFPLINNEPQEPIDPPPDRNARNSVPPLPDFAHPDAPGPSRENVPPFDDAIPDPTTESQSSNAAYIPNEPSLPHENLTAAPAEPQHSNPDSVNLPIEPQQSSSSSNSAPTEPQEVQHDEPSEPEQDDPINDDPFDPQAPEPEANSSRSQSSHPSDPS
uniref:Cytochrome c oxidase assembly protein COX16 homolog, mitochondrial n=1 Tax=Panagrolaimus superbus TaxID=310955 RepID=A0A914YW96_9BILA